jgi:hypothetical protein
MGDLVIVRIAKKYPPFNVGEVAGYPADHAKAMVDEGVATYADDVPVPEPKAEAPAPAPKLAAPKHKGGGVYVVGDQEIKGKMAAWKLYEELVGS